MRRYESARTAVLLVAVLAAHALLAQPSCAQAYAVPSDDATPEVADVSVGSPAANVGQAVSTSLRS